MLKGRAGRSRDGQGNEEDDDEEDDDGLPIWRGRVQLLPIPMRHVAWSCLAYVMGGTAAPPQALQRASRRRRMRALERSFGIDAMHALVGALRSRSVKLDVLLHLRPALRGMHYSDPGVTLPQDVTDAMTASSAVAVNDISAAVESASVTTAVGGASSATLVELQVVLLLVGQ